MNKKLKIQFWKAEKALAMQILEQEGLPKYKNGDGFVKIGHSPSLDLEEMWLRGSEVIYNTYIDSVYFKSNAKRDAYLNWAVKAITDELFTGEGELKVGEMCEVKDYEDNVWNRRKLIAILPEQYKGRFIVETEDYPDEYSSWDCARPISKRTKPTVKECGQLVTYTWEEE